MKSNAYLVEYAKAQVGKPYWFGTFGQTSSKKLYDEKKKQYPKYYTAKDFSSQYGQRVYDCVGLHNGALWSDTPTSVPKYNASQDLGANGLYNKATKKGKIASFDKMNGRLVFKGSDSKKTHVGVYVDGYVIEAKGHAYGVVKTKFNAKAWPYWAQSPFFTEEKQTAAPAPSTPTQAVKTIKAAMLSKASKDPGIDKKYTVVTDKDNLNLRDGPGTKYNVLKTIKKGKTVAGLGSRIGSWYCVQYTDGNTCYQGFCFNQYLK
jgi:hypothetical protein